MSNQYSYLAIESSKNGKGVTVYGYGTYPRYSVLAGQTRKVFLDQFDSVEQAKAAYPKAKQGAGYIVSSDPLGPLAPDWFDPAAAGEQWNDDY